MDLLKYNNNADYSASEAYAMNTYYSLSEYYIPLAVGCLINPS
jgi:hypothetical protein